MEFMQSRINKVTNWRSVQPNRLEAMRQGYDTREKEIRNMNPWKIESEGWSFSAQNEAVVRPSIKRNRAFTGQIKIGKGGLPSSMHSRGQLLRIGIVAFLAADLLLVAILFRTLL